MTLHLSCPGCTNSYQGADGALRCRIHYKGQVCSQKAAEECGMFEREPGADGQESPWLKDGCCAGMEK